MLDQKLKLSAEDFVRAVKSSQPVKDFGLEQAAFNNDPVVKTLRERYTTLAREFQQKQAENRLTSEDIAQLKAVQRELNLHPVSQRFARAQQNMIAMLQECNNAMGEVLGFDFAATAASAARC